LKLLRRAGHRVEYQSVKEKKWHKILKNPGDVVVVAGGDGTVGKVARRLIGTPTPIAILPMGTANNVATTLGISGRTFKEIIGGWKAARCVHFDAGVAKGPWGSEHFIEGFGLGLFAETMFRIDSANEKDLAQAEDPGEEIDAVLKMLRGRLRKLKSNEMTVRLDGKDLSAEYVLLEALNVRFIGPNLNLAPEAETGSDFAARARAAIESILVDHHEGDLHLFVHGGVINAFLAPILGIHGQEMFFLPANTSINTVLIEGDERRAWFLSDDAHLTNPEWFGNG